MTTAKKPRVVRTTELSRVVTFLEEKGERPRAYDLLPGGIVRIHVADPASDAGGGDGSAGWDAVLGA